jgi:hypothetical protein
MVNLLRPAMVKGTCISNGGKEIIGKAVLYKIEAYHCIKKQAANIKEINIVQSSKISCIFTILTAIIKFGLYDYSHSNITFNAFHWYPVLKEI